MGGDRRAKLIDKLYGLLPMPASGIGKAVSPAQSLLDVYEIPGILSY